MREEKSSIKNNVFGVGFENGEVTSMGCSRKGKIWSYSRGTINEFTSWCDEVSAKLFNSSIDPDEMLLKNTIKPQKIEVKQILSEADTIKLQTIEDTQKLFSESDTLLIKITEQQPIARWNNQGFLNLRGEIVNLSNKTELNHLPLLKADDRYTERVMQQYVLMAKLLNEYNFAPLVLELDNTLAWSLTIAPAVSIKLGRDDSIEKLRRLMRVLQHDLNHHAAHIEAVDMRYKQGFAISWKQNPVVAIDSQ